MSNMICLKLISFPTGLECSHWPPSFSFEFSSLVERFFTRFLLFKVVPQINNFYA